MGIKMGINDMYEPITDRYKNVLKKPKERPTLAQTIQAWALLDVRTVAMVKDALFTLDQQITKERMQK